MAEEKKEIHFKIDGKEVVGHPGETVIQVAHREGIPIPHYCYHPGLPMDGNCRMCLGKFAAPRGDQVVPFPKPMTTCTTYPSEGMEVDVSSEDVQSMRKDIMEFFLINHPLDCPICDQAGECSLQDYSYKFGRAKGRFKEEKVHRHTKDLGQYVAIWGERCIVCQRCVRFLDNVSGTSELGVINRGDRSVIDISPGHPVDNPLSLNVVDICPVGALVSRDFLYSQRVWFMKSKDSICGGCSKGCNITIDYDQKIRRIRSRPNPDVNGYWMCDYGRMTFKPTHSEKRLSKNFLRQKDGLEEIANHVVLEKAIEKLKELTGDGKKVGVLGSLHLTCEAMYTLQKLAQEIGAQEIGALASPVLKEETFPGFTIEGDKNPNRKGFEAIFGKDSLEKGLDEVIQAASKGELSALVLVSTIANFEPSKELVEALDKVECLVVVDTLEGPLSEKAHFLFAGSTYIEESGLFVNSRGNYQKLGGALFPPDRAEQNHKILQRLLNGWKGEKKEPLSGKLIREEMLKEVGAFKKLEPEKAYPHLHNLPQGTLMNEKLTYSASLERKV